MHIDHTKATKLEKSVALICVIAISAIAVELAIYEISASDSHHPDVISSESGEAEAVPEAIVYSVYAILVLMSVVYCLSVYIVATGKRPGNKYLSLIVSSPNQNRKRELEACVVGGFVLIVIITLLVLFSNMDST